MNDLDLAKWQNTRNGDRYAPLKHQIFFCLLVGYTWISSFPESFESSPDSGRPRLKELQMVLESQLRRQPTNSATGILPIVTGAVFRVKGLTPEMSTDSLWPALQLGYWLCRAQKKGNWLFMRLFGLESWFSDGLMPLKSCNSLKRLSSTRQIIYQMQRLWCP